MIFLETSEPPVFVRRYNSSRQRVCRGADLMSLLASLCSWQAGRTGRRGCAHEAILTPKARGAAQG